MNGVDLPAGGTAPFHVISLCSGVAGLDLAAGLAIPGARTVCHVERESYACAVLAARMEEGSLAPCPVWTDLGTFDGVPWRGKVDLCVAGIPCFAAGTLVLTRDGYLPIEDVQAGHLVLTHLGRWRPVTAVMRRDDAALQVVRAVGLPGVVTTPDHPFWARSQERAWVVGEERWERRFGEPGWVDAAALGRTHRVSQVLPAESAADEHAPAFWWLVGRYLADGWVVDRKPRGRDQSRPQGRKTVICCAASEEAELEAGIAAAGYSACRARERTVTKYHITKTDFARFLEPFGRYAHGKHLPGFVFELPAGKCRALLEGYLSGDGCVHDNGRFASSRRASTVSKALAYGVALLAQRAYGVVASVQHRRNSARPWSIEGRSGKQRDAWTVEIPPGNRSCHVDGDYGWRTVKESVPGGVGTVYDLTVDEDHSFVADGHVVHNCQGYSVAGKRKLEHDPRDCWPHARRILREVGCEWFLLENVPGLLGPNRRDRVSAGICRVLGELAEDGFDAEWLSLPASAVGASHKRERVFLLARRVRDVGDGIGQAGSAEQGLQPEGQGAEPGLAGRGDDVAHGEDDGHQRRQGLRDPGPGDVQAVPGAGGGDTGGAGQPGGRGTGDVADAGRKRRQRRGKQRALPGPAGGAEGDGEQRQRLRHPPGDGEPTVGDAQRLGPQGGEPAGGEEAALRRRPALAGDEAASGPVGDPEHLRRQGDRRLAGSPGGLGGAEPQRGAEEPPGGGGPVEHARHGGEPDGPRQEGRAAGQRPPVGGEPGVAGGGPVADAGGPRADQGVHPGRGPEGAGEARPGGAGAGDDRAGLGQAESGCEGRQGRALRPGDGGEELEAAQRGRGDALEHAQHDPRSAQRLVEGSGPAAQPGDAGGAGGSAAAQAGQGEGRQGTPPPLPPDGRPVLPLFAPGPGRRDEWRRILAACPWLAPALRKGEAERLVRGVLAGPADWLDDAHSWRNGRLRALGNLAQPLQAATCLSVLWHRHTGLWPWEWMSGEEEQRQG